MNPSQDQVFLSAFNSAKKMLKYSQKLAENRDFFDAH